MKTVSSIDTLVEALGEAKIPSPLQLQFFAHQNKRVVLHPYLEEGEENETVSFQVAGAHEKIYFDPKKVKAGIVTCGGICPGLNNVIRSIVMCLYNVYGCKRVIGFRYGLQGFIPKYGHEVITLSPEVVATIHERGGTMLGTSRGDQSIEEIVDALERTNINQLYIIGGDGTLRAAQKIWDEIHTRNLKIAVIGVPKTIDNDIAFVSQSFGFDTAVDIATSAISCAHIEATSSPYGIGLVKLMGRNSGFIATTAALSQRDVDFVLIPEVKFDLAKFVHAVSESVEKKGHCVIVVAEGAGQEFFDHSSTEKDASGNIKFQDIGLFLKDHLNQFFQEKQTEINLKYIDPSYIIRSVPSNTHDDLFCGILGQNAVHAAMAGKTAMLVSIWHGVYCYLPMKLATSRTKKLNLNSRIWMSTLESTGQQNILLD